MRLRIKNLNRIPNQGFHLATVEEAAEVEGKDSFEVKLRLDSLDYTVSKRYPAEFDIDSPESVEIRTLLGRSITPGTDITEALGRKVIASVVLKNAPGGKRQMAVLSAVVPAEDITRAAAELVPSLGVPDNNETY